MDDNELTSPGPGVPANAADDDPLIRSPRDIEQLRLTTVPGARRPLRRRRVWLPVALLVVTCLSTFWAGVTNWQPAYYPQSVLPGVSWGMTMRQTVVANWSQGLAYMTSLLVILFAHEMGHFLATLHYRIPASLPFFIPFPVTPIGTMGAVIGMDGFRANRREIFDIGLAGPLAGLIPAIPIFCYGISQLDMSPANIGSERYFLPLLADWLIPWLRPDLGAIESLTTGQLNPWFMAGWVGFLITGLNMLPVSQLDGGHVVYALLGQRGHWVARGFVFVAIAYVVFAAVHIWNLMLILVILLGVDHPPTADDSVRLGMPRSVIGYASLIIPILCFPARGLVQIHL